MAKRILLIEDDPLDAALTKRSLRKIPVNNEIVHLSDGQAFLNYVTQHPAANDVCLAIMDLKMPKIDGIQVLRYLQENHLELPFPIVIFSSSNQPTDVKQCYQLGCNAYVAKPMNPQEFSQTIALMGKFWIMANEMPVA